MILNSPIKSKLLESCIGKSCTLYLDSSLSSFSAVIMDADETWIKFRYIDKKKGNVIKVVKLSRIYEIADLKEDI